MARQSNVASPFMYIDPVDGQTKSAMLTPHQIGPFKKQLQRQAKALKRQRGHQPNGSFQPGMVPSIQPGVNMLVPQQSANVIPALNPSCSSGCRPTYGWISDVLARMVAESRPVISFNPRNQVFVGSTQPLTLAYNDAGSLIAQCRSVVLGSSTKNYNSQLAPTPAANFVLTAIPAGGTATNAFGARIRVSNAVTAFKFGVYTINLVDKASGVPVVLMTFAVQANELPLDVICLAVSNNVGAATITQATDIGIQVLTAVNPAVVPASDFFYVETLNERDLGIMPNLSPTATIVPAVQMDDED